MPHKTIELRREYLRKNADKVRGQKHTWYMKNRDKSLATNAAYHRDHGDTVHARNIRQLYGLTREQYNEMLERQSGVCAICGGRPGEGRKRLSVDHDHTTGRVRALLCQRCNRFLGGIESGIPVRAVFEYVDAQGCAING